MDFFGTIVKRALTLCPCTMCLFWYNEERGRLKTSAVDSALGTDYSTPLPLGGVGGGLPPFRRGSPT